MFDIVSDFDVIKRDSYSDETINELFFGDKDVRFVFTFDSESLLPDAFYYRTKRGFVKEQDFVAQYNHTSEVVHDFNFKKILLENSAEYVSYFSKTIGVPVFYVDYFPSRGRFFFASAVNEYQGFCS